MTETITTYLVDFRRHKAGDATALDKYRETPRPPKAEASKPAKSGPPPPTQKGLF